MSRWTVAMILAALLAPVGVAGAATLHSAGGLRVVSQRRLDSRLIEATVSTPALPRLAGVRVLLPAGYAAHAGRRYPVLYLLHGTSGAAADWTTLGDAERTTSGRPLIVVMPDIALGGDGGGWCTNWPDGAYRWEAFHIDQLIPWIDGNLRTIAGRGGRAIAGLSQGGFCSMSYAARHPDLFGVALSFSGAPDIAYDSLAQMLVTPIINLTETVLDRVPANSMFGPRPSEEINWAAHDPTTLAGNLRGMNLLMFTGSGRPGPLDYGRPSTYFDAIEWGVEQLTRLFHNRLAQLHIPSFYEDYGPGTHSWPYWARDLRQAIGPLMADFERPPAPPAEVTYTSADSSYSVFGWKVAIARKVRELSTLAAAGRSGFTLEGSGGAVVMTPAGYRRPGSYTVTISSRRGTTTRRERPDASGRLEIGLVLGPSDTVQEFPRDGPPLGTTVYRTRVTIARAAG